MGEVGEGGALEGEADGEEGLEGTVGGCCEGEVLDVWERWEWESVGRVADLDGFREGDGEVGAVGEDVVEG